MTPAELVERDRAADARFGVYLTVREMEVAARALERRNGLTARTLAERFREKAHWIRSVLS
jgi:hypothetical protein